MMMSEKDCPDDHDNDRHQKHKDGDTVDPMHVLHPLSAWRIRVPPLNVEIFLDLSPNSHSLRNYSPKVNNKGFF
jgi:hypothetical protein